MLNSKALCYILETLEVILDETLKTVLFLISTLNASLRNILPLPPLIGRRDLEKVRNLAVPTIF